jgi:Nucleoside diphosphate kinase
MTSGSSYVILLETDENGVSDLRDLLGATQAQNAKPGTLRYKYAPYGGANCLHLSGSNEEAPVEVALWTDYFSLKPGQFDIPIDDYIQRYLDGPNNTVSLRRVCEKIAASGRPASEANQKQLRELLAPECYDATPEDLEHVAWAIQEACFV